MNRKLLLVGSVCLCLGIVLSLSLLGSQGAAAPVAAVPTLAAPAAQPSAQPTPHTTGQSYRDDDLTIRSRRKPSSIASATAVLSERDELRLLHEWPTPDAGGPPALISPEDALAELRLLQRDRTAELDPPVLTTATSAPVEAPASGATSAPAPPEQSPLAPAPVPPPAPLPPLQVGATLPGMPEYIVVGRTYAIPCSTPALGIPTQRVRFVDYIRNVLANEWVAAWPAASLDAGAIAVKEFAWYTVVIERKWRSKGYPFDMVDSTCDQYYRDASADPRTDAAIQRTWGTFLTRNGSLLRTSYRDTEATCRGTSDCMGQIESAVLASAGQSSLEILARYYNGPGTAVLTTGAQLPAQLPPVPPAPPILMEPVPPAPIVEPVPAAEPTPTAEPMPPGDPAVPSPTADPSLPAPTGEPAPTAEGPTTVETALPDPVDPTPSPESAPTDVPPEALPVTPVVPDATPEPELTEVPTLEPTQEPAVEPTPEPVLEPTQEPTVEPTPEPVLEPTQEPAVEPTPEPTVEPIAAPAIAMPNLVGLNEDQAKAALAALGITPVSVEYQGRERLGDLYDQLAPFTVVNHTPPAGAPAIPGAPVLLGVRAP